MLSVHISTVYWNMKPICFKCKMTLLQMFKPPWPFFRDPNKTRLIKHHSCVYYLCEEKPTRVNWALEDPSWSVRTEEQAKSCPLERAIRPPASFWSLSDLLWVFLPNIELMPWSYVTPAHPKHTHTCSSLLFVFNGTCSTAPGSKNECPDIEDTSWEMFWLLLFTAS